jgi:hypothetical protein
MSISTTSPRSPECHIPTLNSEVFHDHPEAAYWIGRVAFGNLIDMPREYHAAHVLRANVYIDEEHFLPDSARSANGGEYDSDDERSIQFAIVENDSKNSRLIGTVTGCYSCQRPLLHR